MKNIFADCFHLPLLFPPFFSDSDNAACCTNDLTDLLPRIDQQHSTLFLKNNVMKNTVKIRSQHSIIDYFCKIKQN